MKKKKIEISLEVTKKGVVLLIIYLVLMAINVCVLNYLLVPAVNLRGGEIYLWIICSAFLGFALSLVGIWIEDIDFEDSIMMKMAILSGGVVLFTLLLSITGGIISSKMLNTDTYKNVADIRQGNFQEEFVDISEESENIAIVDWETAKRLGDRVIGSIDHASWYEVDDEYNVITYNGRTYRVSPLNYGGFFKYQKAESIPGYVLIDATNQEASFVSVDGGFKYSPSAFFSYDLNRHLRNSYPSYIFDESYFEIDDLGNAYWVTSVKEAKAGLFGCHVVNKVIITDAKTGQNQEYTLEEVPSWVDHVHSLEYLMNTVGWHYEFVNGYWNFSQTGVYYTSYKYAKKSDNDSNFYGYNSFVDSNGDVCFYTGLTPANVSETNVGFVLINIRTGKTTEYMVSGAEESSAQTAAEGLVQNLGYEATFPIVVNVSGQESYLMALKDKAGLIQKFAIANIKNYTIVVEADTIDEAIAKYNMKLGTETDVEVTGSEIVTKKGKISKIYAAEIDGTTYFYYVFVNDKNIYKASITVNEKQVLFEEGNVVSIEYLDTEADIKQIYSIG